MESLQMAISNNLPLIPMSIVFGNETIDTHTAKLIISEYFRNYIKNTHKFTDSDQKIVMDPMIISKIHMDVFMKFISLANSNKLLQLDVHELVYLVQIMDYFMVDENIYTAMFRNIAHTIDLELLGYIFIYCQNKDIGIIVQALIDLIVQKIDCTILTMEDIPFQLYMTNRGRAFMCKHVKKWPIHMLVTNLIEASKVVPDGFEMSTNGIQCLLAKVQYFAYDVATIQTQINKLKTVFKDVVYPKNATKVLKKIKKNARDVDGKAEYRTKAYPLNRATEIYSVQTTTWDSSNVALELKFSKDMKKFIINYATKGSGQATLYMKFTISSGNGTRETYEWKFYPYLSQYTKGKIIELRPFGSTSAFYKQYLKDPECWAGAPKITDEQLFITIHQLHYI